MAAGKTPLLTLASDHSITGERHGFWRYSGPSEGGRKYELYWPAPKNWTDYVILSDDGKIMDGHTKNTQHVAYYRP